MQTEVHEIEEFKPGMRVSTVYKGYGTVQSVDIAEKTVFINEDNGDNNVGYYYWAVFPIVEEK